MNNTVLGFLPYIDVVLTLLMLISFVLTLFIFKAPITPVAGPIFETKNRANYAGRRTDF